MVRRFWRLLRARFRAITVDSTLTQAQRDISKLRIQHRERCVQIITDRNNAQGLIASTQLHIEMLKIQAEIAVNEHEVRRLQKDIEEYETYIAIKQRRLSEARSEIEEANVCLRRDEERIRQKTAKVSSLDADWKESAILREMRREWEEFSPAIEHYQKKPCRATFAALQEMHEAAREKLAQSEQTCLDLRKRMSHVEVAIEKRRRKVAEAEAEGDEKTAISLNFDQIAFEKLHLSVGEAVGQAEESLAILHAAFAQQEAFMAREEAHLTAREAGGDA